jgi:hypothetical protein
MGENIFVDNFGEIHRNSQPRPLTPEEKVEIEKLEKEGIELFERQNSEPDPVPLTEEQEQEAERKRLLLKQRLLSKNK